MAAPQTIALSEHMDSREEQVLTLAKRLGVTWRTIRDARAGKLRSIPKAVSIRDRLLKLDGVRIDLASMLDVSIVRAAREVVAPPRAAARR